MSKGTLGLSSFNAMIEGKPSWLRLFEFCRDICVEDFRVLSRFCLPGEEDFEPELGLRADNSGGVRVGVSNFDS